MINALVCIPYLELKEPYERCIRQYADSDTRDGAAAAAECGDSAVRGAGDHIRHSQP